MNEIQLRIKKIFEGKKIERLDVSDNLKYWDIVFEDGSTAYVEPARIGGGENDFGLCAAPGDLVLSDGFSSLTSG